MGIDCCSSKKREKQRTYENDLNDVVGGDLTGSSRTGMFGDDTGADNTFKYQDDQMDKYI